MMYGRCGARADEMGGPREWLCVMPPQHFPNRPHENDVGATWDERTFVPTVDGSRGDPLDSDPPPVGTLSDVVRALADALEVLPEPLAWEWASHATAPQVAVHVRNVEQLEAWRAWWGAPPVRASEWEPAPGGLLWRTHSTAVERHGQRIRLFAGEHRSAPESPAEKRDRLTAELAAIDEQIRGGAA